MGYDLLFLRPNEAVPLDAGPVLDYFSARPHYMVDPKFRQAAYLNEATGVYFRFDLTGLPPETQVADGMGFAGASFHMNYFRPHTFALEAEPELAAFVAYFGLMVDDPQAGGMGRGAYDREGFLRGWNAGNLATYQAAAHMDGRQVVTMPARELRRLWEWNFAAARLQHALGPDVFVPHVRLRQEAGRARSMVVWAAAVPIVLPRVDELLLLRKPRGLLQRLQGKLEWARVGWEALAPLAEPHGEGFHLNPERDPRVLAALNAPAYGPMEPQTDGLTADEVLDAELWDATLAV